MDVKGPYIKKVIHLKDQNSKMSKNIHDDLIRSLITGEYFVPVETNQPAIIVFSPLIFLIQHYHWPKEYSRIVEFIKAHDPELLLQLEYYE